MAARRFGWHSGNVRALNIQTGSVDISTNVNGDGSATVTYNNTFDNAPSVQVTPGEHVAQGVLSVSTGNVSSCIIYADNSNITDGTLTAYWTAIDQAK